MLREYLGVHFQRRRTTQGCDVQICSKEVESDEADDLWEETATGFRASVFPIVQSLPGKGQNFRALLRGEAAPHPFLTK